MESTNESGSGASSASPAPQGTPDPSSDSNSAKPSGLSPQLAGKRPSIGEDEGGGAEAKLFGKGLGATSLLQIAIRNGIYQNQVAIGGAAKNMSIPAVKSGNVYTLSSANSTASVNSLLGRRRHRHKRNLSLGAPPTTSSPGASSAEAAGPAPSASPLSTLSLDRKTFLRQKQSKQLQAADKSWVRSDLRRGCIHVHDWLMPSHPRPVLCTVDTTARDIASKLDGSKAGAVLRLKPAAAVDPNDPCKDGQTDGSKSQIPNTDVRTPRSEENGHVTSNMMDEGKSASNSNSEICLSDIGVDVSVADRYGAYSGSDMESSTCEDFSPSGPRSTERRDSLSDGLGLGTDSSVLSANCDSATEGPDPFESSSDEVDLTCSPPTAPSSSGPSAAPNRATRQDDDVSDTTDSPKMVKRAPPCPSSSQTRPLTSRNLDIPGRDRPWPEPISSTLTPALFIQLHGGAVRRLADDERPLQILSDYLSNLGFEDGWRAQEEGMHAEIGCLIRFYFGEFL